MFSDLNIAYGLYRLKAAYFNTLTDQFKHCHTAIKLACQYANISRES